MMRCIFFFFLTTIIACSDQNNIQQNTSSKPHKPEWFGATDQKVVERFGLPTEVLRDTLYGKKFIYARINHLTVNNNNFTRNQLRKIYETNEIEDLIIFRFDSLNVVWNSHFYFSPKYDVSYIYPQNRDTIK